MKIELSEDGSIQPFQCDEKGRITIGKEFAGDRVRVAILSRLSGAEGVPRELPRFDELDGSNDESTRSEPTRSEQQAAMLAVTDHNQPYWFGFAAENGTEVGVDPGTHHRHVLVAGSDDGERTTALEHQWQQIISRGTGGILHLTTDAAMEGFSERVRDVGREDDIIEIAPTPPSPRGINVLGLSDREDGLQAIKETIEALLQSSSGGASARAGEAIWNIVRETDGEATLTDVYYVLATETADGEPDEGLIGAERADWLDETVSETKMNDDTRELVMQRLQPWLGDEAIRNGIAATDPITTIPDALDEQKLFVVRGVHPTGIPSSIIALATIIRARYTRSTQRTPRDSENPYYVVTDDIELLADAGPLAELLAEIRSHGMTFVAGCKRFSGWENSEDIINQFGTHFTFSPRRSDARACVALHSQNVEQADLYDLSTNMAYLRTQSGSKRLESIKVEAFEG